MKSLAAHAHLCWVQPERRAGCNLTLPVRCPLPLDGTEAGGAVSSLGHGGQSVLTPPRCCSMQQNQAPEDVECAGTSWTRSAALAQVAGTAAPIFVRGPIRLAPPQLYGFALFPGRTNVIMVHYRHPVEAFVSLFYCVSKPEVCPRRISRRGANNSAPPATAVGGLDGFLLDELTGLPSTALNLLLRARTKFEPPPVLRPFSTPNPRTLRVAQFGSRACCSSSAARSGGAAMRRWCCCSRAATSKWWGTLVAGCGNFWARFPSRQRRGVSCRRPCSPTFATSSRPPTVGTSTRSSPVRGHTDSRHPPSCE